jgi:hypothetical protein
MEKVIKFVQEYLEEEHRTVIAFYTERDQDRYQQRKCKLDAFSIPEVEDKLISRSSTPSEEFFEAGEGNVNSGVIAKRPLFQIKLYKHPEFGELYRVYLGPTHIFSNSSLYDVNLFVTEVEGQLKVIAVYKFNRFAGRQRRNYFTDHGLGWNYQSGKKIETLGILLDVRKFQVPDDQHGVLAEYNAE